MILQPTGRIKLQNLFIQLCRRQSGSAAVITALSMVALMGFSALVVDLGVSYNETSKLQNALDSAALAAVQELPADNLSSAGWTAAENEAIHLADANDIALTPDDIQPLYQDGAAANKIIGIKVRKSISVDYHFARALGFNTGTVTRTAAARLEPCGGVTGAVPLSITASSLNAAIEAGAVVGLTIKCSSNTDDIGINCTGMSGWFGALRFDEAGASVYSELIANGYAGNLHVGQELDTENGNMSGPTLTGFTTRYNKCTAGCTADCHEPNCPRIVYIPVVEIVEHNRVRIVSFAPFFLLECGGSGKNSYIKATYIPDIALPDAAAGPSGQDFGLYVSRLSD